MFNNFFNVEFTLKWIKLYVNRYFVIFILGMVQCCESFNMEDKKDKNFYLNSRELFTHQAPQINCVSVYTLKSELEENKNNIRKENFCTENSDNPKVILCYKKTKFEKDSIDINLPIREICSDNTLSPLISYSPFYITESKLPLNFAPTQSNKERFADYFLHESKKIIAQLFTSCEEKILSYHYDTGKAIYNLIFENKWLCEQAIIDNFYKISSEIPKEALMYKKDKFIALKNEIREFLNNDQIYILCLFQKLSECEKISPLNKYTIPLIHIIISLMMKNPRDMGIENYKNPLIIRILDNFLRLLCIFSINLIADYKENDETYILEFYKTYYIDHFHYQISVKRSLINIIFSVMIINSDLFDCVSMKNSYNYLLSRIEKYCLSNIFLIDIYWGETLIDIVYTWIEFVNLYSNKKLVEYPMVLNEFVAYLKIIRSRLAIERDTKESISYTNIGCFSPNSVIFNTCYVIDNFMKYKMIDIGKKCFYLSCCVKNISYACTMFLHLIHMTEFSVKYMEEINTSSVMKKI
ncbi:hypothetical protein EDEG_01744 [Edhazardia aedis USNM 41457]|uniref:Uncharacterized protein n=1 Tax=Edhazardia aedis (strain USNM 41457) TaxID=1003232 RepID=J9DRM2_EDHAE|nr:hypothetical protein EDEG_01744 [Edhazardia aedis USNM 41457]|eukprot:EJW03977.1 hypothetical protein EDEG_01744 [Edhazardia aedis USNM 41457]